MWVFWAWLDFHFYFHTTTIFGSVKIIRVRVRKSLACKSSISDISVPTASGVCFGGREGGLSRGSKMDFRMTESTAPYPQYQVC